MAGLSLVTAAGAAPDEASLPFPAAYNLVRTHRRCSSCDSGRCQTLTFKLAGVWLRLSLGEGQGQGPKLQMSKIKHNMVMSLCARGLGPAQTGALCSPSSGTFLPALSCWEPSSSKLESQLWSPRSGSPLLRGWQTPCHVGLTVRGPRPRPLSGGDSPLWPQPPHLNVTAQLSDVGLRPLEQGLPVVWARPGGGQGRTGFPGPQERPEACLPCVCSTAWGGGLNQVGD